MLTSLLTPQRLSQVKVAYTARHLDLGRRFTLVTDRAPRHGDLVVATVVAIGQHQKLELATSRRSVLYPGDEVLVAAAGRYAPDQFEAELAEDLGPCDLVAAGGIAARTRSAHSKMDSPRSCGRADCSPTLTASSSTSPTLHSAGRRPRCTGRRRSPWWAPR